MLIKKKVGLENWNLGIGFGDRTSDNRSWGGEETMREENGEDTTQSDSNGYGNCNSGFSNRLWSVSMHFPAASHFLFDGTVFLFRLLQIGKDFWGWKSGEIEKDWEMGVFEFLTIGDQRLMAGWVVLYTEFSRCWIVQ